MIAFVSWQWSGPESKAESSRGFYRLARIMPNIFIGLWLLLIASDIYYLATGALNWAGLVVVVLWVFIVMGSLVWGLRYLSYRYVSHVRITPAGLEVTRGASTTVRPWVTIGEIHTVPFIQPALWAVSFKDGAPTAAFFTAGSSWMVFGVVKAKSALVDEIRRLADEAKSVRTDGGP